MHRTTQNDTLGTIFSNSLCVYFVIACALQLFWLICIGVGLGVAMHQFMSNTIFTIPIAPGTPSENGACFPFDMIVPLRTELCLFVQVRAGECDCAWVNLGMDMR